MSDEIVPHARPIATTGEPEWFPPQQDDSTHSPANESRVRHIFHGDEGLRAGWSLLLFFGFAFLIGYLCVSVLKRVDPGGGARHPGETPALQTIVGEAVQFLAPALAALIMTRIERRRFSQYGLGPVRPAQFGAGMVWGLGALSLLVGVLWKTGLLVFTGQLIHGAPIVEWGLIWAIAFLLVGLSEEYLTRAYLQFTLARGIAGICSALGVGERNRKTIGFWFAALFFSLLFGLGHKSNAGESPMGLWSAGLIGLVFCFSLWRTGSLWWAIGMHAAWDWAQSFVYGVADSGQMVQHHLEGSHPQGSVLLSGGTTGPEGSVYVLAIILLLAVGIAFTLRSQRGSPSQPETWNTDMAA
ncbi:MAG: CPBP family intramembrane glutamic endopeptidase [Janthinobacterium lividum]